MVEIVIDGIANDMAINFRNYVVFDPNSMNSIIIMPNINVAQFEFKPIMFQMLQVISQYSFFVVDDLYLNLRKLLEVANNFKLLGVTDDVFRLRPLLYSLRDRDKAWIISMEQNFVSTWNDLDEKFLAKYFPHVKNAKMINEITSFRQVEDDSVFDAW